MGTFERTVECDGRQYEIYRVGDGDDDAEYALVDTCGGEIARFDAPPDNQAVEAAVRAVGGK